MLMLRNTCMVCNYLMHMRNLLAAMMSWLEVVLIIILKEESMIMNPSINLMIIFICHNSLRFMIQIVTLLTFPQVNAIIMKEGDISTLYILMITSWVTRAFARLVSKNGYVWKVLYGSYIFTHSTTYSI
jgi:hypothetical protein